MAINNLITGRIKRCLGGTYAPRSFYDIAPERGGFILTRKHSQKFLILLWRARSFFSRKAASSSNFRASFPQLHRKSRKKGRWDRYVRCVEAICFYWGCSAIYFFICIPSREKPNRRVTCGLWWKLGQVPRVTNFFIINPKQIAVRSRASSEKPYELTNASRRRSVLKDFLFSALGVPRWWWRGFLAMNGFWPTHAHSMHAGRRYSP